MKESDMIASLATPLMIIFHLLLLTKHANVGIDTRFPTMSLQKPATTKRYWIVSENPDVNEISCLQTAKEGNEDELAKPLIA
jgi:hypothetical protein